MTRAVRHDSLLTGFRHDRKRVAHEVDPASCQVEPWNTVLIALFNPVWASEMTSFTPSRPRGFSDPWKLVQGFAVVGIEEHAAVLQRGKVPIPELSNLRVQATADPRHLRLGYPDVSTERFDEVVDRVLVRVPLRSATRSALRSNGPAPNGLTAHKATRSSGVLAATGLCSIYAGLRSPRVVRLEEIAHH
jgi:hypothetical protein